jgi:hypothetical protein
VQFEVGVGVGVGQMSLPKISIHKSGQELSPHGDLPESKQGPSKDIDKHH